MEQNKSSGVKSLMLCLIIIPAALLLNVSGNRIFVLTGAILSIIPEAVVLLILTKLYKRGNAPTAVKKLRCIMAIGIFSVQTVLGITRFIKISEYYSGQFIGKPLTAVLILLPALYIGVLSFGAVSRTSTAVMILSFAAYFSVVAGAVKNADITAIELYSKDIDGDILSGFIAGLTVNEGAALYILAPIKKSERDSKNIYRYLLEKMFVYIIIFIPTIVILKESINQAYMPVYELCVYSKSVIIERFDGIFMMILTLLFIIKTGTELSLVKASIKDLTGRKSENEKT